MFCKRCNKELYPNNEDVKTSNHLALGYCTKICWMFSPEYKSLIKNFADIVAAIQSDDLISLYHMLEKPEYLHECLSYLKNKNL